MYRRYVSLVKIGTGKRNISVANYLKQNVKQEYYKTMSQIDNIKPETWDTARSFHEIPGPKEVPIFGNTWRWLPYIGKYYGVPLKDIHKKCVSICFY